MSALPEGTVTVLFSDIEGSTTLVSLLGEHWAETLSGQRELLRAAWAAHGGTEMGTEGDSFFVVFGSAHDAVLAAVDGQRALQQRQWPLDTPVRVRMGLHTGEPQRHEDGYIGLDVHRGARISGTAHGGQVVLSAATAQLVPDLVGQVGLRDLGWHRLKDLDEPEHLYDLVVPGLVDTFPPLRSLGTQANLPRPTTELVGRDDEVTELQLLLDREATRLVTVTGPGGTGKTRLALATASRLADSYAGVFFVQLASAVDGDGMWAVVAQSIGAGGSTQLSLRKAVAQVLAPRVALLVLDNLEQIDGADRVVADLLSDCPDLKVIATSRRPLHLVAEQEWQLEPLGLPRPGADAATAMGSEAVRLFCQRAQMVRPSFALTDDNVADVIAVCQRLDGLPLALELAAARMRMLSPHALLARIDDTLGTGPTASDRPERQRTLRDTIAWSHDLLDATDRRAFRRLAAFVSACPLEAAEHVLGSDDVDALDTLTRLVDASLVRVVDGPDGEPTVLMLQTIRAYGREQLMASDDAEPVLDRHAEWYADLATVLERQLRGPNPLTALDAIDASLPDIRAAMRHTLEAGHPARLEVASRIVRAMSWYWYRHRFAVEARYWHERLMDLLGDEDSEPMVQSLHGAALGLLQQGDQTSATELLERALRIARRMGDKALEARELNSLGLAAHDLHDRPTALRLLRESLAAARLADVPSRESTALTNLVVLLTDMGDYTAALEAADASIALDSASGDRWGIAVNEVNRIVAIGKVEGPLTAHAHLSEVAGWIVDLGDDDLVAIVLDLFVYVHAELEEWSRAARLAGAAAAFRTVREVEPTADERQLVDEASARVRDALGAGQWESEFAAGSALDSAEALTLGTRSLGARAGASD